MKTSDSEAKRKVILKNFAIMTRVNLEGWWHPRQHIRNAEGEKNE
tara:strand:- start:1085 stop:1219 length:135 start_codon:yes stop_codon:yes gene_type:complete